MKHLIIESLRALRQVTGDEHVNPAQGEWFKHGVVYRKLHHTDGRRPAIQCNFTKNPYISNIFYIIYLIERKFRLNSRKFNIKHFFAFIRVA